MSKSLESKVAVITGAGRGIGRAIAISYAANGAKVCCISRSRNEIEETAELIRNNGGNAIALPCDVTSYESLVKAFADIDKTYGGIDIVVIDAGVDCEKSSIENLPVEDWNRVMDVNLNGAFFTAKAAIPYLKKNGGGKIITMGSGLGHKGRANNAPYSCSKAGLWMLTRVLAQELYQYNISVNELIPGPVITVMGSESKKDSRSVFSIDGEWIKTPEDVTDIALFLASQPLVGPTAQSFSLMRRDL